MMSSLIALLSLLAVFPCPSCLCWFHLWNKFSHPGLNVLCNLLLLICFLSVSHWTIFLMSPCPCSAPCSCPVSIATSKNLVRILCFTQLDLFLVYSTLIKASFLSLFMLEIMGVVFSKWSHLRLPWSQRGNVTMENLHGRLSWKRESERHVYLVAKMELKLPFSARIAAGNETKVNDWVDVHDCGEWQP